jgi:hypothetical protein
LRSVAIAIAVSLGWIVCLSLVDLVLRDTVGVALERFPNAGEVYALVDSGVYAVVTYAYFRLLVPRFSGTKPTWIVTVVWIAIAVLGSLVYLLYPPVASWSDALYFWAFLALLPGIGALVGAWLAMRPSATASTPGQT